MSILHYYVDLIYSLVPNFWIATAISVLLAFLLVVPLKLMALKNSALKESAMPDIEKIKRKYGINALGGSTVESNPDEFPEEIRILTNEQREEKSAEEIEAVYHRTGYKPFTGWMPGVTETIVIFLLYFGILASCPSERFIDAIGKGNADLTALSIACLYVLSSLIPALVVFIKAFPIKQNKLLAMNILGLVLKCGLTIFICLNAAPAIILALLVLTMCGKVFDIASKKYKKSII